MSVEGGWQPVRRSSRSRPGVRISTTPFGRLAVAHVLAIAGDTLVTMALAGSLFFSISPDAAQGRVALYLLLTMAPFAVVAPLLGPVLDRNRNGRRLMLIACNGGRAVVCLLMARHVQGLLLFPEAFVVLVASKAYSITKSALVPATVADQQGLVEANSRLQLLAVVSGFVAAVPGVAVLKIGFLGASWVLRLAAVVFAGAAVAAYRLARPSHGVAPVVSVAEEKAELHAASVRLSVTAMAVLRAAVGFVVFLTAFELRRDGAPAWWFGVVLGASMVGGFLGAAVAPRLRQMVPEERILGGSLAAVAVVGALAAYGGGRGSISVLAFVLGAGAAAGKLAFDSIVQRDAPDAIRGRTFARFETRFQLVWVAGAAIPVIIPVPLWLGMLLVAIGCGVSFVVYESGLRAIRRAA